MKLVDRFKNIGWNVTPSGCWEWRGSRFKARGGYGQFHPVTGRTARAHRVAYEIHHGVTLARTQVVLHTCDNPPCVNPAHLVLGTQADNMTDKARKGRAQGKLTPGQVREIRASSESSPAIARRLGVTPRTIRLVRNFETYKDLT